MKQVENQSVHLGLYRNMPKLQQPFVSFAASSASQFMQKSEPFLGGSSVCWSQNCGPRRGWQASNTTGTDAG